MGNKFLPSITNKAGNFVAPIGKFYISHQSIVLPVAQVGLSIGTTIIVYKNANFIQKTIDDAKVMLSQAKSHDEEVEIYRATIKELSPKVLPIVVMMAGQIVLGIESGRAINRRDKKINELTDLLATANNAIFTYQAFQKEAEAKLGEKKVNEIKDEVAKKVIEDHPETKDNALKDTTSGTANDVYHYFDNFGNKYFWSTLSPSAMRQKIADLSYKFSSGDWNQYDDMGCAKCTVNEIYDLIDPRLKQFGPGDTYGWVDEEGGKEPCYDFFGIDINGATDPSNPDGLVWVIDMEPIPLFRRQRW